MQVVDHSGVFFIFVPAPHQALPSGSTYGESTIYELKNFTEMGVYRGISLRGRVYGDRSYASGFEFVLVIGGLLSTACARLSLRLASSRVLVASDWRSLTGCPTCEFW